jgi:hypothetical protein
MMYFPGMKTTKKKGNITEFLDHTFMGFSEVLFK